MVNDVNEVDFRTATAHMHSRPQRPRSRNTKTNVDIQKDFLFHSERSSIAVSYRLNSKLYVVLAPYSHFTWSASPPSGLQFFLQPACRQGNAWRSSL